MIKDVKKGGNLSESQCPDFSGQWSVYSPSVRPTGNSYLCITKDSATSKYIDATESCFSFANSLSFFLSVKQFSYFQIRSRDFCYFRSSVLLMIFLRVWLVLYSARCASNCGSVRRNPSVSLVTVRPFPNLASRSHCAHGFQGLSQVFFLFLLDPRLSVTIRTK